MKKSASFLAISATLLACTVSVAATARWQSPDRLYSILPPTGWKEDDSKNKEHPSYAFIAPDGKSEIRISATYHLNLPEVLPDDVIELAFKNESGLTPIQKIRGEGWNGLRREYTNSDKTQRWLAVGARRGSTAILLTMNAPAQEFERLHDIFESVAKSLRVGQELMSEKDRDEIIRSTLNHFWGEAVDSNDKPIQPKDDQDRETVPIPTADAYHVTDAGIPAGVATWAHLDWKSYYLAFMQKERRTRRWSDKQIAFIGVLFGTAQGRIEQELSTRSFDESEGKWATLVLQEARDDL